MPNPTDRSSVLRPHREADGRVYDAGLQCSLKRLEYNPETRIGMLWLGDGECTDMSGAIAVFQRIDPEVQTIVTWSGCKQDTAYHRTVAGAWRAVRIPPATRIEP
jgi:hypothetical protein